MIFLNLFKYIEGKIWIKDNAKLMYIKDNNIFKCNNLQVILFLMVIHSLKVIIDINVDSTGI